MVKYETIEQLEKEGYTNSFNKEVWTKHINDDEFKVVCQCRRCKVLSEVQRLKLIPDKKIEYVCGECLDGNRTNNYYVIHGFFKEMKRVLV